MMHYISQNKKAKPLVSAYDDSDKTGIEDDLDFYEDPKQKKKDARTPGGGFKGTNYTIVPTQFYG